MVPYTFVHRGVPVRENTYPEPLAYEVGWPVPFLATFISPVLLRDRSGSRAGLWGPLLPLSCEKVLNTIFFAI